MSESVLRSFHLAELSSPLSHPAWPWASAPQHRTEGGPPDLLPAGHWPCTVLLGVWELMQEQSPSNPSLVLAEMNTPRLPNIAQLGIQVPELTKMQFSAASSV